MSRIWLRQLGSRTLIEPVVPAGAEKLKERPVLVSFQDEVNIPNAVSKPPSANSKSPNCGAINHCDPLVLSS